MAEEISVADYIGPHADHPDLKPEYVAAAEALLGKVNALLARCARAGVKFLRNPATRSLVSGTAYGGWRPQSCPIGAPQSSHKVGRGVDVFDPHGAMDNTIMAHLHWLDEFGLAIEHPSKTPGWCHVTDRLPPSGKRVFYP